MGDYGISQVFSDAWTWTRSQLGSTINEWGMTGVGVLVGFAVLWKLLLRIK